MTELGIPTVPQQRHRDLGGGIGYAFNGQHFDAPADASVTAIANTLDAPLSVIVQVTKRCDFDCSFCSETLQMPDPTLEQLDTMRENLAGVSRVFLSGGEPLARKDFGEVVDIFAGHHIDTHLDSFLTRGGCGDGPVNGARRLDACSDQCGQGSDQPRMTATASGQVQTVRCSSHPRSMPRCGPRCGPFSEHRPSSTQRASRSLKPRAH
ncbi:radical SAM protein [Streptomyces aureus]|uniref:radical SAM protein n=1 Tax=Streptomyces aureus TaxID=193461 RepID=UPI0033FE598D